ncbi:MAG TPA: hypothetical protein VF185_02880 [Patescibacteria group bacterium]
MGKKVNKMSIKKILGIIILLNIAGLLAINFFPYPENFVYPYLTSHGLIPYKQIFDQHFPGLLFFPINFYSLGMRTPEDARFWLLATVVINHILIFLLSGKLFKSKWYILPNLLYAVFQPFFEGYVLWIDSIAPIFLLTGAYFLITKDKEELKIRHYLLSGLFLGIGIVFKQIFLPIVGLVFIYLFLKEKNKSKALAFLIFPTILTSLLFIYMKGRGVWDDFWFWTVKFNATTFAKFGRKYPSVGELAKTSLVFGFGLVSWVYIILKDWSHNKVVLGLFLVGGLMFAYARFDFVHLQPALPFAVLIISLFLEKVPKNKYLLKGIGVWVLITGLIVIRFYKMNVGNSVYFFGDKEAKLSQEVEKYAKPGESVFAFATTPAIYPMTNTLPSGHIFVFDFPWFMMEAQTRVLLGLESDPPKVVIKDDNAIIDGMKFIDYMQDINIYIEKKYKTVGTIDGIKIMIPR